MKYTIIHSLLLSFIVLATCSCSDPHIEQVKSKPILSGSSKDYGTVFEHNFNDPQWESETINEINFVTFTGTITERLHKTAIKNNPYGLWPFGLDTEYYQIMEADKDELWRQLTSQPRKKIFQGLKPFGTKYNLKKSEYDYSSPHELITLINKIYEDEERLESEEVKSLRATITSLQRKVKTYDDRIKHYSNLIWGRYAVGFIRRIETIDHVITDPKARLTDHVEFQKAVMLYKELREPGIEKLIKNYERLEKEVFPGFRQGLDDKKLTGTIPYLHLYSILTGSIWYGYQQDEENYHAALNCLTEIDKIREQEDEITAVKKQLVALTDDLTKKETQWNDSRREALKKLRHSLDIDIKEIMRIETKAEQADRLGQEKYNRIVREPGFQKKYLLMYADKNVWPVGAEVRFKWAVDRGSEVVETVLIEGPNWDGARYNRIFKVLEAASN